MAQVKIYGLRKTLLPIREALSDTIHNCIVQTLKFPTNKRAHRFIYLEDGDFFMPEGRSDAYLILELLMIQGRKIETKKKLIRSLFQKIHKVHGISLVDIEICILESPAVNWGFRGKTGDEASISYTIEV